MKRLVNRFYKHIILFIFLGLFGSYLINVIEDDKKEQYLGMQAKLLQTKYNTNYKYFKIMSKDIQTMYADNNSLTDIYIQIADANKQKRAQLRADLYDLLYKRYLRLRNMGVKQLHFHLPDNTSFLRMHKPERFDDNLTNIRPSVVFTNKNKQFSEGFEVGKSSHGFRFVYPMYNYEKKHIGSFEISFSSEKLLENILDNYINDTHLLVLKEELDQKIWKHTEQLYYEASWENPNYLIEKATHKTAGDINLYEKIKDPSITKEIVSRMKDKHAFAISSTHNYESIVLSFVPIINFKAKDIIAYIVTYTESDYLDNVMLESYYLKILFYSILVLLFLFGIYIISNKEKLRIMAHYDELTELPNRSFFYIIFENEINRASRHKEKLGLLFIDLDGFKSVNDTYGHNAGDELLIQVAQRLKNSIRIIDAVARLGGDEFTVVLTNIKTQDEVTLIANKIIKNLNKDFIINQEVVNIGASIGASLYPEHSKEIDILVQTADDMMYKAKDSGKNNIKIYQKPKEKDD